VVNKIRKFKKVAKSKKGVPTKYLSGAKNKSEKEKEILETRRRYKKGLSINVAKVSKSRVNQAKKKTTKRKS
tara:strand:+ start:11045 stop:11260 length:216 start_codon:yes stop_codon:yes gene_type:complete